MRIALRRVKFSAPPPLKCFWYGAVRRQGQVSEPRALPKFLLSVDYLNCKRVRKAYQLLKVWEPVPMEVALQLLGAKYADAVVRAYAVESLSTLSNAELARIILQLVQVRRWHEAVSCGLGAYASTVLGAQRVGTGCTG